MAELWLELVKDSIARPRQAARRVLSMRIAPMELVLIGLVVTCVGIILAYGAMRLSGGAVDEVTATMLGMPLLSAVVEFGVMGVIVLLTTRIGALFGGQGGFWDAAALVVWLNVVLLLIQIVQILFLVLLPPLAGLVAIAAIVWALWAFANFVTELHGFENPVLVLGAVVLTAIVLFISLAMVITILGISSHGL